MPLEISVDPGVCQCGISFFRDGVAEYSTLVRFIPETQNFRQFRAKLGGQRKNLLIRTVHHFLDHDKEWHPRFSDAHRLILESTGLDTIDPIFYGFLSWWIARKPLFPVAIVDPRVVSRWAEFGPVGRAGRKKEIRERVKRRFPFLNPSLSQDETDAVFNWMFYTATSKKRRTQNETQCATLHSWSCNSSRTLLLPSPSSPFRQITAPKVRSTFMSSGIGASDSPPTPTGSSSPSSSDSETSASCPCMGT